MANEEHLRLLKRGVAGWNAWRGEYPNQRPDLSEANLRGVNLRGANLHDAFVRRANLGESDLRKANLSDADFREVELSTSDLREADLSDTDLREADLTRSDLRGADLSRADLIGASLFLANLINANLGGADLRRADLRNADLRGARLGKVDLSDANLSDANLSEADLRGADLKRANLSGVDLRGAQLHEAMLSETVFGNTDLREVKGLEECIYRGPNTIDHRTVERSGSLPLAFLRGCGLPDTLIDYLPSLLNQPIQFYSCFISYSSKDEDFAKRLHADLQGAGVRCWFADEDLKIGDPLHDTIDTAIRRRDKLMLLLSATSVASAWVEREVRTALEEEAKKNHPVLFPVRLDDAVMNTTDQWAHDIRRNRHIGDFTDWKDHDAYQKSFQRLLRDLKVAQGDQQ